MRAAKGSSVIVTSEPFDSAPTGTPTATVTRADGTALTAPAATVGEVANGAAPVLVTLTAADHLDELDTLTVTFTAEVDGLPQTQVVEVDVIGSHWLTVAALRQEPKLSDTGKYPNELLRAVRDEWEQWIEELCNRRFTPGYGVETHRVCGSRLVLDAYDVTAVRSVTVDGVDRTADVTLAGATLTGPLNGTVVARFEHGMTRPPGRLVRESRSAIQNTLVRRNARTPSDVVREASPEGGPIVTYAKAEPTRYQELNAAIMELKRHEIGVA